ncbi:MAG: GDSL-type esterase/lipase family protein [Bacteroidota bacterium]|nr:GDSL-type esterase/lipase family protein [Bacteroidota bacterium]MDP4192475.1 GDSL-type esterase/lipase family protein [Bacteroidota bacterium]MDP4196707.1 GDSL-type esterase/lipase family protein [Bacteroidota bacterium]
MKKLILLTSIISLFFCKEILSMTITNDAPAGDTLYLANPNYKLQTGLYSVYKTKHANIVMLGNSITHGVNWFELLGRNDVIERGIPSDNVAGFLNRMDFVYKLHPKICFVMGGINDIYSGITLDALFDNYKKVIEGLREKGIIPVIQATLYVSPKWHNAADKNPDVEKFDQMLKNYAKLNKIEFLDLNPYLTSNKFLRDEFTFDGLHLKAEAYKIWGQQVEKILSKYGL